MAAKLPAGGVGAEDARIDAGSVMRWSLQISRRTVRLKLTWSLAIYWKSSYIRKYTISFSDRSEQACLTVFPSINCGLLSPLQDEGSFSAAARKLRRAQSVVSELVSGLEGQIGVALFDRFGPLSVLTLQGAVLWRMPATSLPAWTS